MSILGVDFGSVSTRAVLIDVVDGSYQLVARAETRTTDGFPINDITVGLDRVLRELGETTGRTLTGDGGAVITPEGADRSGVDTFVTTASIGRPLRAVLVGLMPNISIASAMRATAGTYIQVVSQIHLGDGRTEQERLNRILLSLPDAIFLVGGLENGARHAVVELAKLVRLAVLLIDKSRRPPVIYAGNSKLVPELDAIFKDLTQFLIGQNIRPTLNQEELEGARLQLGRAFDLYKEQRSKDFAVIAGMSESGVMPTAQGYSAIVNYLGHTQSEDVISIDIGSSASVLAASVQGDTLTTIRSDLGLGHSAELLVETAGRDAVRHWLPFHISESALMNYAANKRLRPATVPNSVKDVYIEHAMLRAAIGTLLEISQPQWKSQQPRFGVMIGAGAAITGVGHPGYTALLLLDTVQPTGITRIYADPFALIPVLGGVASVKPDAVVQVLDTNNFEPVGTCFSVSGTPRLDREALRVRITLHSGELIEQVVLGGHLWRFPLPIGQIAEVQIRAARGLSVGGRGRFKLQVEGSAGGLIFDARGRPLPLAPDAQGRASQIPLWLSEATDDPIIEIDPQWLQEPQEDASSSSRKAEAPSGGRRRGAGRRGTRKQDRIRSGEQAQDLTFEEDELRDELKELRDALS